MIENRSKFKIIVKNPNRDIEAKPNKNDKTNLTIKLPTIESFHKLEYICRNFKSQIL